MTTNHHTAWLSDAVEYFKILSSQDRFEIFQSLLDQCTPTEIYLLDLNLKSRNVYRDFIGDLPLDCSFHVIDYLSENDLIQTGILVSKTWYNRILSYTDKWKHACLSWPVAKSCMMRMANSYAGTIDISKYYISLYNRVQSMYTNMRDDQFVKEPWRVGPDWPNANQDITALDYHNTILATGDRSAHVTLWSCSKNQSEFLCTEKTAGTVSCVCLSDIALAVGLYRGDIVLYKHGEEATYSNKCRVDTYKLQLIGQLVGHVNKILRISILFSDYMLVSLSHDCTVKYWDISGPPQTNSLVHTESLTDDEAIMSLDAFVQCGTGLYDNSGMYIMAALVNNTLSVTYTKSTRTDFEQPCTIFKKTLRVGRNVWPSSASSDTKVTLCFSNSAKNSILCDSKPVKLLVLWKDEEKNILYTFEAPSSRTVFSEDAEFSSANQHCISYTTSVLTLPQIQYETAPPPCYLFGAGSEFIVLLVIHSSASSPMNMTLMFYSLKLKRFTSTTVLHDTINTIENCRCLVGTDILHGLSPQLLGQRLIVVSSGPYSYIFDIVDTLKTAENTGIVPCKQKATD